MEISLTTTGFSYFFPMGHGSIQCDKTPWVMGHTTLYNGTKAPWVMGCTMVPAPHGSWVVQQYQGSMGHGLYNGGIGMQSPWVMGCTTVLVPHGSWIVQRCWHPMGHGLYNGTGVPWVMGCTMILILYTPWIMQQYSFHILTDCTTTQIVYNKGRIASKHIHEYFTLG